MDIKQTIEMCLAQHHVSPDWVTRSDQKSLMFPHTDFLLYQFFQVGRKRYLLIYPEDRMIVLEQLEPLLGEIKTPIHPDPVQHWPDFPTSRPLEACTVWIDETVRKKLIVHLKTSLPNEYLKLGSKNLLDLFPHAVDQNLTAVIPAEVLSPVPLPLEAEGIADLKNLFPERLRQRLEDVNDLPAFPEMGRRILELKTNPEAGVRELSSIISQDPSLAAQVMSWSMSPYYGYSGRLVSLDEAIIKVLGYDRVLNLVLGVILGKIFSVQLEGPLGLKAYWQSALYTALCAEGLYLQMHIKTKTSKGVIYLCGLLHNLGHLVVGHLLPSVFARLNQWADFNRHIPIRILEQHLMGITHDQIGSWLLERWRLPEIVVAAVRDHHRIHFNDSVAVYSDLILVASRLVAQLGVGDASLEPIPSRLLGFLGLNPEALTDVLEKLKTNRPALDKLCSSLMG